MLTEVVICCGRLKKFQRGIVSARSDFLLPLPQGKKGYHTNFATPRLEGVQIAIDAIQGPPGPQGRIGHNPIPLPPLLLFP